MRKIFVIGTLHAGVTPNKELIDVVRTCKPDQVLVEIAQSDIDKKRFSKYPPEMQFAYKWAKKNGIKALGFDSKINILPKGLTKNEEQKVVAEQIALLGNLTWKDLNTESTQKVIETENEQRLIDKEKQKKRESKMLRNVRRMMLPNGNIVIITGCSNMALFEQNITGVIFPLR